jgi:single-strand DNA-binding protein
MNFLHIAGHLGADPEIRFTSSGKKVTSLRVACKAGKSGTEDNTIWWRVTIWGEQFDKMVSYLKKGSAVMVMGEMNKTEIYKDREGNPQISHSMTASNIMFSPFGKSDRQQEAASQPRSNVENHGSPAVDEYAGFATGQQQPFQNDNAFNTDDEIPF